jgi:hypothetical protein
MPGSETWVWYIKNLQNKGRGAQRSESMLIKVSECFMRVNICNHSKSLPVKSNYEKQ